MNIRRLSLAQLALLVIGIALGLAGLFGARIGLIGVQPFSGGQIIVLLVAVLLIYIGAVDRSRSTRGLASLQRGVGGVIVIIAATLIGMEFFSLLALNMIGLRVTAVDNTARQTGDLTANLSYYREVEWAAQYFTDYSHVGFDYVPYLVWRHRPMESATINIDANGNRRTPDTRCDDANAFTLFVFGGSTMWGQGVPDEYTIPAYLQQEWDARQSRPLCIVNFGAWAYVSTQESILLLTELQQGNIPDAAVFYDGHNDTYAAYQNGRAGAHQNFRTFAARFSAETPPPLVQMLQQTYTFGLIRLFVESQAALESVTYESMGVDADVLAQDVINAYDVNRSVIEGLAGRYDFDVWFFWQPDILVTGKVLNEQETRLRDGIDPPFVRLLTRTYALIESEFDPNQNFYSLMRALDNSEDTIWVDYVHLSPEGNAIIARAMMDVIEPELEIAE